MFKLKMMTNANKKHVLMLTCVALVLLIIWQVIIGVQFYSMIEKPVSPASVTVNQKPLQIPPEKVVAPLFGVYVPKSLDEAGVKASDLNVTVVGIMYADEASASQVLIHLPDGYDRVFRIGDKLPNGAVIQRITEDGVLILSHGSLERLNLPKDELIFEPPAKPLSEEESDAY